MTREDAIYWIKNLAVLSNEKDMASITEALTMAIEALSENKRTDKHTETHACDCISRQAAIEAIHECSTSGELFYRENHEVVSVGVIEKTLLELPSAQLENITCKDCKHLQKWRSEESAKKFGQIYVCARNVFNCPKPEDFCSFAERRVE